MTLSVYRDDARRYAAQTEQLGADVPESGCRCTGTECRCPSYEDRHRALLAECDRIAVLSEPSEGPW